jgi:hypothetical protein
MGRFDALTQLDEPKKPITTPVPSPKKPSPPQGQSKNQAENVGMSTNPQTHLPTKDSPIMEFSEKPEKYTTHLEPSLIKRLKLFAVERDLKDYQVIKNAILAYFDQNR